MHTHKNLFDKVLKFKNLLDAYNKACAGKRDRYCVAKFNFTSDSNLYLLKQALLDDTYIPGGYKKFYVYDPKLRLISAPPFIDRIVHHAVCNVIEPIFDKTFIYDSYACRKGKGTHAAVRRLKSFLRKGNTNWVLKCDISKYFASINKEILISLLRRKIADKKLLGLLITILYSHDEGIPIGNLTSQLFANIYLTPLDLYVKQVLKVKYYLRYMDDFMLLGNSKEELKDILNKITHFVNNTLKLNLHPRKIRLFPASLGVDFVGYIVYKDHIRLRSKNVRKFKKKLKKLIDKKNKGILEEDKFKASINAWIGHAIHADSYRLRSKLFSSSMLREFCPVPLTSELKTQSESEKETSMNVPHEETHLESEVPLLPFPRSAPVQLCLFDCLPE